MTESLNNVFLGTSGWSYKEWIGPFYSKEDKSMLRAYAKVFSTVEIDSTFYRYPSKGTVMGWTRYSPDNFVYAAKLPQLITHEKKLDLSRGVEDDLQKFLELMEPLSLSGKLGCILVQLPPKFDYRPREMESFCKVLPTHIRFAVEFRDLSWMRQETWTMLGKYKIAFTIVDEPLLPPEIHLTSDIAYFRWHGRGSRPWYNYYYNESELAPWVPNVKETSKKVKRTFGYFNNHYHGYAVENCLHVLEMLGKQTPQQAAAREKAKIYLETLERTREPKLETFTEPKNASFEELLRYFTAAGRLERVREIQDSELKINRQTDELVEASIRTYHIIVDYKNKTILHDCPDWERIMSTKKLCKHVAKLVLTMDMKRAVELLRNLISEGIWEFKLYVNKEGANT